MKYVLRKKKPDICLLSETHVTEETNLNMLNTKEYTTYCCTSHSKHTGGVFVYIKKKISSKNLRIHKTNFSWYITFDIKLSREDLKIAVIYLSASENKNMILDSFESWLEDISDGKTIICCGDFNINALEDNQVSRRLNNLFMDNGLRQTIDTPTRVTQNSSTLIDLCVTNINENLIQCMVTTDDQISDHRNIEITIRGRLDCNKNKKKNQITIWKNYTLEKFWNEIELWLPQWAQVQYLSVDEKMNWLLDNLKNSLQKFRTKKLIGQNNEFFDDELELMRIEKNRLYKIAQYSTQDTDWKNYKVFKNIYKKQIETKKYQVTQRQLNKVAGDMKGTWKILNNLLNGMNNEVTKIQHGSLTIEDDQEIANQFNIYFIESVREINTKIPIEIYEKQRSNSNAIFCFNGVSIREIKKCAKELKNNTDEFNLNSKILLDAIVLIGSQLADIINESLKKGIFPKSLKTSTILPIQKVLNTNSIKEFRPINLLPCLEKMIEKIAYNQFNEFIIQNDILKSHQSGFRKSHSCESAINDIMFEWKMAINDNKSILAVFLDLQRAFETIEPDILINKLENIGVREKATEWFISYLTERKQKVKFNEIISDEICNSLGVPQGSILGPLLFNIYINDLGNCLEYCRIKMFADDTLIFIVCEDVYEACNKINDDLQALFKNLCRHKLKLNVNKTKSMLITNKKLIDISRIVIKINDEKIELVNEIKYLGIIIDNKLNFEANVNHICRKLGCKVNVLSRLRYQLNCQQKISVYKTIIEPHFKYCSTILFLSKQSDINRLQLIQNKCMRNILRVDRASHQKDMLNALKFLSVEQIIKFNTLVFVYKIVNGIAPIYLSNKIVYNYENERKNTLRNRNNIELMTAKKKGSQNSLFYRGVELFNNLPNYVKNEPNLEKFKNSLYDVIMEISK